MEDKSPNRRIKIKLNLFDIVIICLALAAAAVFYFVTSGSGVSDIASAESVVRYTITLDDAVEGTGAMVETGDELVDNIKNYNIGTVISVEYSQSTALVENYTTGGLVDSPVPGRERIVINVEASAVETARNITIGGGFVVRAGNSVSIVGPGYAGAGYITHVERSDG